MALRKRTPAAQKPESKKPLGRPKGTTKTNPDQSPMPWEERLALVSEFDSKCDQIMASLVTAKAHNAKYMLKGMHFSSKNARRELRSVQLLSKELWDLIKPSTHNPKRFTKPNKKD